MTLFYLCIAWLSGIALASPIGLPLASSLLAGGLFFLSAFTVRKLRIPFLCLAFFLLGSARLSSVQPQPGPTFIGSYVGSSAEFEVVLEEDPIPRGAGFRVRARVARVVLDAGEEFQDLDGSVLVEFRTAPEMDESHSHLAIHIPPAGAGNSPQTFPGAGMRPAVWNSAGRGEFDPGSPRGSLFADQHIAHRGDIRI
jgi:hypothetical protein